MIKLNKYPHPRLLELGCGKNKRPGYLGLDLFPFKNVDFIVNLKKGKLPFASNSFDGFYSYHLLEHLEIEEIEKLFIEIVRVGKNGSIFEFYVPHYTSCSAFYEYHKTFFRENSFREFIISEEGMYQSKAKFKLIYKRLIFTKEWYQFYNYLIEPVANRFPGVYRNTFLRNLFPADEIHFIFQIVK